MKRLFFAALILILPQSGFAQSSVVNTVHNLSTSGPGQYKSETVDQVCAFCHTPHRAARGRGLWNRVVGSAEVELYTSSTSAIEEAELSGSSLLCQSCHDGTIALGQMLNPPRRGRGLDRNLLSETLSGRSVIGSNLTNHHPIGFNYDDVYSTSETRLKRKKLLDLPLEEDKVQCTSCHDPHSSKHEPFLHKSSNFGELCLGCHELSGRRDWSRSSHASSIKEPREGNPWPERKPEWAGKSVEENSCQNCHASHFASQPQRLMTGKEEDLCFKCHDGSLADIDLRREFNKFSRHTVDVESLGDHDAVRKELKGRFRLHVECEDCHNPHTTRASPPMVSVSNVESEDFSTTTAPYANDVISNLPGIDIQGAFKQEIDYQYELCFRCHGEQGKSACSNRRCSTAERYQMERQDNLYNLREKVDPTNPQLVSWHPIVENNQSNNFEVPSLIAAGELNASQSLIYCTDCHNNDSAAALGGEGPNGPHGSRHEALLAFRYQLNPNGRFNVASDTLCFTCHDLNVLLSDVSFPHRRHVLQEGNLCAHCHDPHGSAAYPHLLNFLISSTAGQDLLIEGVEPFKEPTWINEGRFKGTCYLSCHGVVHNGSRYGEEPVPPVGQSIR